MAMSNPDNLGLSGTLSELESQRLAAFKAVSNRLLLTLAATIAVMALGYLGGFRAGLILVAVIGGIVALIIRSVLLRRVTQDFKRRVMPVLVRGIDPSLSYDGGRCIAEGEFNEARLYMRPDRYSGKDLVQGNIGATAVRFSLVHAEEKYEETETDSDGQSHSHTEYRTIFRGLFFIADFNKHFTARTKVEPHGVGFLDKLFGAHVELENPEFNKLFAVSSTDQVEARYIMTPELMEQFMALRAKVGNFKTAFADEHVFMALEMGWDAFEPSLKVPLTQSDQVDKILSKLRSVTGIVEQLGLNVRIWSKA